MERNHATDTFPSQPTASEILRAINKTDKYSSSLEANITGSGFSSIQTNSRKESPTPNREARINNNLTPKSSPADKAFVPPKTPLVPSNPFVNEYDESKNPFAEDDKNPFNDDDDDDDYDKNLNRF